MANPVEAIKNNPWKTVLAVIPVITTVIYFMVDLGQLIVTQKDLNNAKTEIINELRDESAKTRIAYVHDLELRLEDAEVEMESLEAAGKSIPLSMRRKVKRLHRIINGITTGTD